MALIFDVLIRSVLAFYLLVLMTRLLGKKVISQLNFFDFIVGITIGSIAAAASTDPDLPLVYPLTAIGVWTAVAILNSWLALKIMYFRKWTEGEATLVVYKGKLLERNMARIRYNSDDLMAQLRNKGVFSLDQVEYALLETDGHLSVLQKAEYQPLRPEHLGLDVKRENLPVVVISEGKIIRHRLKELGVTEAWLRSKLQDQGVADLDEVVLAQIDSRGHLYYDLEDDGLNPDTK
ncbi:MAG: DUF421 domain-containing protein [Firmicutes bacterium]|nr:DUF421 domain-containing protein [Bacillota bacterium]